MTNAICTSGGVAVGVWWIGARCWKRCAAHLDPGGTLAFNGFTADDADSGATTPGLFPQPWQHKAEKRMRASPTLELIDLIRQRASAVC